MSDTPPPAEFLAVESAGRLAGISPRTLRHWIATGKLSAIAGKRGKLVSIVEVRRLAMLTGKVAGNDVPPDGNPATSAERLAEEGAGNLAGDTARALVTDAARQQLGSIRDEWLQPLIDRIAALEREGGRLEAERDAAREQLAELRRRAEAAEAARQAAEEERDALRLQLAEAAVPPVVVVAAQDATEPPPATIPTPTATYGLWARLRRALGSR